MYRTDLLVSKSKSGVPIFIYREHQRNQTVVFEELPAYPFEGESFEVWRNNQIVLKCTEIKKVEEGTTHLVAFHGLTRLMSFFGSCSNLTRRWVIHPYDFRLGDKLVFITKGQPNVRDELVRNFLTQKALGSKFTPGAAPPSHLEDPRQKERFNKLRKRSFINLTR